MGLDDLVAWNARLALQAVDVLREQLQQQALFVQERDKAVCDCGSELSRIEIVGEGVEGEGILSEVGDVEHGFGVREIELCEVGIEASGRRAEVGDAGGGGDSCTCLSIRSIALTFRF